MAKVTRSGDAAFKKAIKSLSTDKKGRVGWMENAKYEDGTPVAYVAAIQEFGYAAGNIPPRPFFRNAIAEKERDWAKAADVLARRVIDGKATGEQALEALVEVARADVFQSIALLQEPPLSPRTIAKRLSEGNPSTKPLIDSSVMQSTLIGVVG